MAQKGLARNGWEGTQRYALVPSSLSSSGCCKESATLLVLRQQLAATGNASPTSSMLTLSFSPSFTHRFTHTLSRYSAIKEQGGSLLLATTIRLALVGNCSTSSTRSNSSLFRHQSFLP